MRNILRWFWRDMRPKQTTFVYCPFCRVEQISNDCFVEDTDLVMYRCCLCGTQTRWDFDAPAPLLIYVRTGDDKSWEMAYGKSEPPN